MITTVLMDLDDTIFDFKACERQAISTNLNEFDVEYSAEDGCQKLVVVEADGGFSGQALGGNLLADFRLYQRIKAVGLVDNPHEGRYEERAQQRLDAEPASQDNRSQNQQRNVHAQGGNFRSPAPQMMEHHRKAVCSARSETVRLNKEDSPQRKDEASTRQKAVFQYILFGKNLPRHKLHHHSAANLDDLSGNV